MTFSLRRRLLLTLTPLLLLLGVLGGAGVVLLQRVGARIDLILRENYDSIAAMSKLDAALTDIDASFQLALLDHEDEAQTLQTAGWNAAEIQMDVERHNLTILPEEERLFRRLEERLAVYRRHGEAFFRPGARRTERTTAYFGGDRQEGLRGERRTLTEIATAILRLNENHMKQADRDAQQVAHQSLLGFAAGLIAAALLGGVVAWRLVRSILQPIESITHAAQAIGAGQLNRTVPVLAEDELGRLAQTFNLMTQQLRDLRRTNLERLLRAQQTSQATIDSFADPVLVVDPEGRVELTNPAARQVFGVAPVSDEQPEPRSWEPPDPLREPLAAALRDHQPFLTERFDQVMTFRLGGEDRAFLPQIHPIRSPQGDTLGASVVLDDVTRFRLLDQLKSNLAATVSHELKTPLTGIRLALHLLLEETIGPLEPKQAELLVDARDNAERLFTLVEQLLALARLESDRDALHPTSVDPIDLLRSAAEAVAPRAADKHLILHVETAEVLPPVAVDTERLGHALNNLLDNAVAHTEPGGRITLSAVPAGPEQVDLLITDTGRGIPPEYLPHLFERFFRVPANNPTLGTGLGLAIVREIVLAHGGAVSCTSAPGRGTTFRLTLPVWKGGRP